MDSDNSQIQRSYFDVLGICCSSEVPLVENIVNSLPGVKECSVIVTTRTVIVLHDSLVVSQLQIVKALNQARLEANVRVNGSGVDHRKKWPSPYAMGSGVLLVVSLFGYLFRPLLWVALGAVAVGIFPILLKGIASLRKLRFDITILAIVAVIGTIVLKDYVEAATIVFLFSIAEWLEARASYKAQAVMVSLMSIAPQRAVIAETGEEVDVDVVKLNTILAVKPGEVIPIDGIVVSGKCEVDEKTLTGESFPVMKEVGSTVYAGTINIDGFINVQTSALPGNCVVANMTKLVEEAQNTKSKTQRFIDKCAQYYTPAVIIISAGLAIVPLACRVRNMDHWYRLSLVVLVSACPCALILSTPVATFCALTRAATAGMLIRGGEYLETLAKVRIMAFDKTGTLTRGEFIVNDFESLSHDVNQETLLYWVGSIESKSSHPMATALVDYAQSLSVEPKPEDVEDFQNFPGEGIYGKIDGRDFYIGNRKIAARAGSATVPEAQLETKGQTSGFMFCNGKPVAAFSLSDKCRTGVAEALTQLSKLNIKTAMLTGDSFSTAMRAHEELNSALTTVHAELLPDEKARIINSFKKESPTAMVGDGINDAPALATADIGISMGISGSALATETAQVILMTNDLRKLPKMIILARRANRKVIENVALSMITKGAILALAIAGHPLVWAAVLADVGTCLVVIMNSMLLLKGSGNHDGNHCHSSAVRTKNCTKQPNSCCSSETAVGPQDSCCSESKERHNHVMMCCKSNNDRHCYQIISNDDVEVAKNDCSGKLGAAICFSGHSHKHRDKKHCHAQRSNLATESSPCYKGKNTQLCDPIGQESHPPCCQDKSKRTQLVKDTCCVDKGTEVQPTKVGCCDEDTCSSFQISSDNSKCCKGKNLATQSPKKSLPVGSGCRSQYAKQCCNHSVLMSHCGVVGGLTEIVVEPSIKL